MDASLVHKLCHYLEKVIIKVEFLSTIQRKKVPPSWMAPSFPRDVTHRDLSFLLLIDNLSQPVLLFASCNLALTQRILGCSSNFRQEHWT